MDQNNKFAAETVRQLQQSLNDVAPYQATALSKQQTIRTLAPQILALRDKGYSWTSVAAMLTERGVPVSVAGLRTYLRRVREETANEVPRSSAKRLRDPRTVAPPGPPAIASSTSQNRETLPASKSQPTSGAPSSTVATQQPAATVPRHEPEPRRSTFTVRPDTKNI